LLFLWLPTLLFAIVVCLHCVVGFCKHELNSGQELAEKVKKNRNTVKRWTATKILVIDEISMLDSDLFDKLNTVAQVVRKQLNKPFGGIQVVACGDFFQVRIV
jgi:ATP-dependent DNA helicase PIF1